MTKPPLAWHIFPSEKAAERKRRELFAQSKEIVSLGENVFSLPHFLKTIVNPAKPVLKRLSQKYLIASCLKKTPLKYFEKLKGYPGLAQMFLEGIQELKRFCIVPDDLEILLKESGTLKEYDLWVTYRDYETLKEKLGVLDEEDYYQLPHNQPAGRRIVFENFIEKPPALEKLIQKIRAQCQDVPEATLPPSDNAHLYSLPTPFQETNWFIQKLGKILEEGTPLSQIGILTGGAGNYYEAIWQKLKNLSILEEESPLLPHQLLPQGRMILKEAGAIDLKEASLEEWIGKLEKIDPLIDNLLFQETLLPFGKLNKREWTSWLKEVLDEKPQIKVSSALSGLQWLNLGDGDFPSLKYLWVPGLIEGQFPSLPPRTFFQNKKDRGLKEWRILCEAFPEMQATYERKQKMFLHQLAQIGREAWLTVPRLDSLGNDVSPSSFTWDFATTETVKNVGPVGIGLGTVDQGLGTKLRVEKEREQNRLETKEYHTVLEPDRWKNKIAPMRGEYIFSPSQLETYAQCPFKYYAWRVLNIPRKKEYAPEVDADDKGTLFHNCMEKFLKENGGELEAVRRDRAKEEAFFAKLETTVEQVFKHKTDEMAYANPVLYRHLEEKTLSQAKELMIAELEEARNLEAPLTPTHFEWCFGTKTEVPLELGDVRLGGRVDRIDCDPETKRFLVLDYKTGSIQKFKDRRLQGLALQLPLYILAVRTLLFPKQETVGGLLIAAKTAEKKMGLVDNAYNETHFKIHKRSSSLMQTEELDKAIQEIVQWVQTYVKQIRNGTFSAQPKECKTTCDYKEICRYAHKPLD